MNHANTATTIVRFLCLFSLLSGFSQPIEANTYRIQVDGERRTFRLYVPDKPKAAARSLVILLHGNGGNIKSLLGESGRKAPYRTWLEIAERNNLLLAIPGGKKGTNGKAGWNDCRRDATGNPTSDDVAFIDALIDDISSRYRVDQSRIFATGTSNGGQMTMRLALELSNRIAAIATVAAAMPSNSECSTHISRPIPILMMNGTRDPILPWQGGIVGGRANRGRGVVLSARQTIDWWVDYNHADEPAIQSRVSNRSHRDESHIRKFCYPGGRHAAPVLVYEIKGGGHTEPSLKQRYSRLYKRIVGNQNADVEMANEVWAFFKNKRSDTNVNSINATRDKTCEVLNR